MGKIVLIMLCFMLGINNVCYADVMVPTLTEEIAYVTTPVFGTGFVILGIALIIVLSCLGVAKINKSEESIKKYKSLAENVFFYLLIVLIFLTTLIFMMSGSILVFLVGLVIVIASIYFRNIKQNKKISYDFISGYFVLFVLMILYVMFFV